MTRPRLLLVLLTIGASAAIAAAPDSADAPTYTAKHELVYPANYREWIFMSSGLGMSYSDRGADHQMFTNTFVPQAAYHEFMRTGKWPDKTIFVVEDRGSETKGSINKSGHFQSTDFMGIDVEVKDSRLPDGWAYFNFSSGQKTAGANPKSSCFQCHEDHAAVEHTFVQFYPTLKPVAEKFGTYHEKPVK